MTSDQPALPPLISSLRTAWPEVDELDGGNPQHPDVCPGSAGHTYYFRIHARDNAGNVEAWPPDYQTFTTVESMPPSSSVQPLPRYTWTGNATMSWDGQDFGRSTILTFELQCRMVRQAPGKAAVTTQRRVRQPVQPTWPHDFHSFASR